MIHFRGKILKRFYFVLALPAFLVWSSSFAIAEIDWCSPMIVKQAQVIAASKQTKPETPQQRLARLTSVYDKNSDGMIDRDEYLWNHFNRVMVRDLNKDQQIIYAEEAPIEARCYLQNIDLNKDGIVSEQEAREHADSEYRSLDKNNNGQIELSEI